MSDHDPPESAITMGRNTHLRFMLRKAKQRGTAVTDDTARLQSAADRINEVATGTVAAMVATGEALIAVFLAGQITLTENLGLDGELFTPIV